MISNANTAYYQHNVLQSHVAVETQLELIVKLHSNQTNEYFPLNLTQSSVSKTGFNMTNAHSRTFIHTYVFKAYSIAILCMGIVIISVQITAFCSSAHIINICSAPIRLSPHPQICLA